MGDEKVTDIRDHMKPPKSVREFMERETADPKERHAVEQIANEMRAEQGDLHKIIVLGRAKGGGLAKLDVRLSADGVFSAWGSTHHSAGQILEHIEEEISEFDPGARAKLETVRFWWYRWHLNSMHAGCEHQRAAQWDQRPIDPTKPLNAYGKHFEGQQRDSWNMLTWITRKEHPQGLLNAPCPTCGYKFGSRWLKEEIPADVRQAMVAFLTEQS